MDRRERTDDLTVAVSAALSGFQARLWTSLPGIIESFDPLKVTCSVQVALSFVQQDKDGNFTPVNVPLLVDCPVVFPGGGGFCLTFPLKKGDECLIQFASRCIDAWWQSGGVQPQAEFRMHDLSDGFVIPGVRSIPSAPANVSTSSVQLRNDAGTALIDIAPSSKIRVVTTADVQVVAPVKVQLVTPLVECTGNITASGNITSGGSMMAATNVTAGGNVADQGGSKTMADMRAAYNNHHHGSSSGPDTPM